MPLLNNGCCDPLSRPPKKLSCVGCANLVRYGCMYFCRLTQELIPFPNNYVCAYYQGAGRRSSVCKCCGETDCNTGSSHSCNDNDCCNSGLSVNSCHQDGGREAEDIWCHMRCSSDNQSNLCRVCCGEDCATPATSSCKCCQTIHQRLNF